MTVNEILDEARQVIDGECDCHTPEYRALDLLERALRKLDDKFEAHYHNRVNPNV
jgi:ribosome-associated translation inhibitor RaiA